jgi:hypothetical protein
LGWVEGERKGENSDQKINRGKFSSFIPFYNTDFGLLITMLIKDNKNLKSYNKHFGPMLS